METIHLNRENLTHWQQKAKSTVIALGFFDGLHHGHCEVIKTALRKAKERNVTLSVMSFFPHPKTVLSNGKKKVCYLMPLSEKEEMLQKLGVDTFYIVEFDQEFASLPPEQFVTNYLLGLGVVHAVAGFDFSYGSWGMGNMDRLKSDSGGRIEVTKVEKVERDGEKISSTCIRERLVKGKVEEIPYFLGRPYEVKGNWDGFSFNLSPYYTLPACGYYDVTVKTELNSIHTKLLVIEGEEGEELRSMIKVPPYMKGRVSIVWRRRIPEDSTQTFEEKNWILSTI